MSLSRMNKPQLYEECKRLLESNMRLHLFQDDNLIKENEELEKENEKLINDVSCLEDLLKNKKEEEKCTMSSEEEMNMVEKLSEELGEKELRIMALEKELEHTKDSINFAVVSGIAYECRECNYLTENLCKNYEDKKFPDGEGRCWECRNDDTSSEEEEELSFPGEEYTQEDQDTADYMNKLKTLTGLARTRFIQEVKISDLLHKEEEEE